MPEFETEAVESEPQTLFGLTAARLIILMTALLFLAGVVGYRIGRPEPPGARSADVGFLQDMIVHHQQAVVMSYPTASNATDPVVRSFAKEIIALQQFEMGLMVSWLEGWGHPRDTPDSRSMAWAGMSHPKEFMPGMATEADINSLHAATGVDVDEQFLRLMIHHHVGGVAMGEEVLKRGKDSDVRALADRIIKTQRTEITEMQFARKRIGLPAVDLAAGGALHGTPNTTGGTQHPGG
jgi:uncharacterized protein (DUF305 family)